jgi:hypothetical protein
MTLTSIPGVRFGYLSPEQRQRIAQAPGNTGSSLRDVLTRINGQPVSKANAAYFPSMHPALAQELIEALRSRIFNSFLGPLSDSEKAVYSLELAQVEDVLHKGDFRVPDEVVDEIVDRYSIL